MAQVTVPDIGDFADVPVIEVLVEVGQEVAEEDPLVTLESDKATMEVPAPFSGKVESIVVKVGDRVSEGSPILELAASENGAAAPAEEAAAPKVEAAAEPAPAAPAAPAPAQPPAPDGGPVYASPSVRRLAREKGIDLATITGTGRKGRITLEDLEAPKAAPSAPSPQVQAAAEDERVPLSRIKKISGPRLQQAWQAIPHVTQFDDADITDLEAFRKRINSEQDKAKVTMVALLMKACVPSLKAYPEVNSSLDGDDLILRRSYHIGFAADTPQGLMVPVIRDVDRKGIIEIAGELTELSGKARAGKIAPGDLKDATFTISSLGGIGGTAFTPIINPPQVAILGASRSATKPVWDGAAFVPRLLLPLSFSYDHRVIDGALAARFTSHLVQVLGDMKRVLL